MRAIVFHALRLMLLLAVLGPWAHAHCLVACGCCDDADPAPEAAACCDTGRDAGQDGPSGVLRRGTHAPMEYCSCGDGSGERVPAVAAESGPRVAPSPDAIASAAPQATSAPAAPAGASHPPGGPPASRQALHGVFRC